MEELEQQEELKRLKDRMASERPADWDSLPDIPLYMDQVVAYLGRQLITFRENEGLTSAMINNYIKDGIVPRANGKRYEKEHLATLTAVAALKQVLSVRDLATLLKSSITPGSLDTDYERFLTGLDTAFQEALVDIENGPDDLPSLACSLALRSYADLLACRRILDLLRMDEEEAGKDKKKKK